MKHTLTFSAMTLAAALAVGPAMAQLPVATTAPATVKPTPTDRNPIMTQGGKARLSKVVGSSVYNDNDQKIGSVDDLVVDKDGNVSAIISVGGFLGLGSKYVEVPYANLTFGDTQQDIDNRVILKGVTKESLTSTPGFTYYKS